MIFKQFIISVMLMVAYFTLYSQSKVGIGTNLPTEKLEVVGNIKADSIKANTIKIISNAGTGKVLTSDAVGNATWQNALGGVGGSGTAKYISKFTGTNTLGNSVIVEDTFRIGINNSSPTGELHIGSTPVTKKLVLYDNSGLSFFGFGVDPTGYLRYQVPLFGHHVFKESLSPTTERELMRISSGGYVGINTTFPQEKLHVSGTIRCDTLKIPTNAGVGKVLTSNASGEASWQNPTGNIIGIGTTNYLAKFSGSSVISSSTIFENSGNVGIGSSTPHAPLQFSNTAVNRKIVLAESVNNDHQFNGFGTEANALRYQVNSSSANHIFYAGLSSTTSSELMRIFGNGNVFIQGNVGIGNNAPSSKLDVNGNVSIDGDIQVNAPGNAIIFPNVNVNKKVVLFDQFGGSTNTQFYGLGISAGILRYHIESASSNHVFYAGSGPTTATELVRITGNGRLGIGTASPTHTLTLSSNSAAKPSSSTWDISSDARLKKINGSYTKGLAEVIKLNTIKYNYKEGNERNLPTDEEGIGFVAQELQKIFPEAVKEGDDGYLSVDLHPVLISYINAIKELNTQNENLKMELAILKESIKSINERLEK